MPTYYDPAMAALTQMHAAADELGKMLAALEARIDGQAIGIAQTLAVNPNAVTLTPSQQLAVQESVAALVQHRNAVRLREKHEEWGRKLHGVIMGYVREMETGMRAVRKGRTVDFTHADVAVGTTEPHAKAVQHKHTVSPENGAVNEMIAKAANQLTGESGEKPLPGQRLIIDVMINDPQNWWPFDLADFDGVDLSSPLDGAISFALLKTRAQIQILTQLTKYKTRSTGLNADTIQALPDRGALGLSGLQRSPHGAKTTALAGPGGTIVPVLTVKIVYGQPRTFLDAQRQPIVVRRLVFAAFRNGSTLSVQYQEHS